jgi:hypothetical protein
MTPARARWILRQCERFGVLPDELLAHDAGRLLTILRVAEEGAE